MSTRFPVYVISKGRAEQGITAKCLQQDGIPFRLVVEPQEEEDYRSRFGDVVTVLPFSNLGQGGIPARNWCWDHAMESGAERHWILDDNIYAFYRWHEGRRLAVAPAVAFDVAERFTARYENIGLTGFSDIMFAVRGNVAPPFRRNCHVYSCILINHEIPYRWRGRYNEDTDLCLQALSGGWCTVQINAFLYDKVTTMTMSGGNTDELYVDDGRLRMARALERVWPGIVTTSRRFHRPQHHVNWKLFDVPLRRRTDFEEIVAGEEADQLVLRPNPHFQGDHA